MDFEQICQHQPQGIGLLNVAHPISQLILPDRFPRNRQHPPMGAPI